MRWTHRRPIFGIVVGTLLFTVACAPAEPERVRPASATSAAELGGMDALVAAAKKEGALNLIALPPDWANYGAMITAFGKKYGIRVNSGQPDYTSQDEINAARGLKGTPLAPDVLDLGANVALANTDVFAPYKVATWADFPEPLKEPTGLWFADYGGYMSIGYDAGRVPAPSSIQDLLKSAYKGKVSIDGDPTAAGAAFNAVVTASLGNGGSPDDIGPGVDFFGQLKRNGNLVRGEPNTTTIQTGKTSVVIDWDYLNAGYASKLKGVVDWKILVPQHAVVGSYYVQAVHKDAPHPAAARLWEEFLYSDEGQNIWLRGLARPVRADAMRRAGTIDAAADANLPPVVGDPVFLSPAQTDAAKKYLTENWNRAVS
ncbi:ABC transporter substrate-binding protein [Longispora fulva]|uniref:Putative spermidine/putrescine transport system substrate-binding protein n=1 Tax=Longispora fulva TaxID=619741 RepID=A0A8J7GD62_9ACTN|nr:ABC transporter substrate-binding protein [Longispora fulva]MBG6135910.1 putative spermidine/putrescine transport system substrate-binding protein [Longispora fulva]GIG55847.1 ABC transporter substrate-binding protein [Longispora fulva]